jgi:Flp pilus assembly protein TadD
MLAMAGGAAMVLSIRAIANAFVRRRMEDRRIAEATGSSVGDERMARLEAAVESIAIEVERISEGQRFTTRLLTEHAKPMQSLLPKPGKFDTPH